MIRRLPFLLALSLASIAPACAMQWQMEPADSRLEFVARWEGTEVPGVFRSFDSRLSLDRDAPDRGALEVDVDIVSADMDSDDVNEGIAGAEWFDSARFPAATFQSIAIQTLGGNRFEAVGKLTLKGVTREIAVPFTLQQDGDQTRMRGELTLQRTDFGIGTGEWTVGDIIGLEVDIRFDLALTPGS